MDKVLIFLRHGQAESNAGGYYGGQHDVPLTALGRQEAADTAPMLAGVQFDKVYCSDLSRAMDTAALAIPGCNPEIRPEIREVALGEVTLKTTAECTALWGEHFTQNRAKGNFEPFGGESLEMLDKRIGDFLDEIIAKEDEKIIGIVSHGGAISSAARHLVGRLPLSALDNCGVCIFVQSGDKWVVKKWNATAKVKWAAAHA